MRVCVGFKICLCARQGRPLLSVLSGLTGEGYSTQLDSCTDETEEKETFKHNIYTEESADWTAGNHGYREKTHTHSVNHHSTAASSRDDITLNYMMRLLSVRPGGSL